MTSPDQQVPRRVVTGHDDLGRSVVVSDGSVPVHRTIPQDGVAFFEIWQTGASPAPIAAVEPDEPTARDITVPPPAGGTKIRINEFKPGHNDERGLQSPVHRTESIDYGIVLEGEITLVLDSGEVTLRAGDVVVQRGTDHAWANRGTTTTRVAFVLIDGAFDADLRHRLPGDLTLMHGAPDEQSSPA